MKQSTEHFAIRLRAIKTALIKLYMSKVRYEKKLIMTNDDIARYEKIEKELIEKIGDIEC